MRTLILILASNAGLGYAPVASGTVGTLAGLPLFAATAPLPPAAYGLFVAALIGLAFWVAQRAGRIYGVADDGRIVIDELAGYMVTVAFLPFTWTNALLGFFWFRVFDVFKVPPASTMDKHFKNGVGVVLDDVFAGVYAAVALRLSLWLLQQL